VVLVTSRGEQVLRSRDCAGFPETGRSDVQVKHNSVSGPTGQTRTIRSYFAQPDLANVVFSLGIYGGTVLCIEGRSEIERIQFASR
jgi:hypothetical protein